MKDSFGFIFFLIFLAAIGWIAGQIYFAHWHTTRYNQLHSGLKQYENEPGKLKRFLSVIAVLFINFNAWLKAFMRKKIAEIKEKRRAAKEEVAAIDNKNVEG